MFWTKYRPWDDLYRDIDAQLQVLHPRKLWKTVKFTDEPVIVQCDSYPDFLPMENLSEFIKERHEETDNYYKSILQYWHSSYWAWVEVGKMEAYQEILDFLTK